MILAYIFGYGSLLHPRDWALQDLPDKPAYGALRDYRRTWRVGIDNMSPAYDKKHYRYPSGERADSIVATLGVYFSPGSSLPGLAIPVDAERLSMINKREKSYRLSDDFSHLWQGDTLAAPLRTYLPKEENTSLYLRGEQEGTIVLPRRYLERCQEGFAYWGEEADLWRGSDEITCPLSDFDFFREEGEL